MPPDSFQFVNVTPDHTEHTAETRRRIRSQAMRDYRRKRRIIEEEEEAMSSPEGSTSSLSSPQQSSSSRSRQESRRRTSSTQSMSIKPEAPRRQSSGTSRDELPAIESLQFVKGKRRNSQSAVSEGAASSSQRRKRTDGLRAQHGTFGSFSVNLPKPKKTSSVLAEAVDPLSSPDQLEQMLSICESYNRWLISTPSDELHQTHSSGTWDNLTSQMILFSLCLKSIGHLDALQHEHSPANKRLFKTRVLALANKRLKNPAKALEDKTIGALACLTSYEISRGSFEAGMHLRGLAQIIKLRGGTENIGQRGGLSMFLETLDLIHAIYFRSRLMYTSADRSQPSSNEDTPHPDELSYLDQAFFDELGDFIVSIPDLVDINEPYSETRQTLPSKQPPSFENEIEQWYQDLKQAEQALGSSYNGALAYVCGLTAGLHLATTSPVSAHPARLYALTDELFTAMANLPEEAWDSLQTLHIRILLTSLSASQHLSHKSWYNAHLTKRLYQTEGESWSGVKSLIMSFLDMHAAVRQPRKQTVRVLVNGIEIVVDESEAREKGMAIQTSIVNEYPEPSASTSTS